MKAILNGVTVWYPSNDDMACQYAGQCNPQPAYLEIDPMRMTICAEYNHEIGNAVPMDVWHNRIIRVPCEVLQDQTAMQLMFKLSPLVLIVCNGYSEEWDGNNFKGHLDDDAQSALDEITEIVQSIESDFDFDIFED